MLYTARGSWCIMIHCSLSTCNTCTQTHHTQRRSAFDHVLRVFEEAACNREMPNKSVLFFRQDNYAELVMGFGMKGIVGLQHWGSVTCR